MRILLAIVALACLTAAVHAATEPGTILTTTASVSYCDSTGCAMPMQSSNPLSVLVIAKDPPKPVYLTIKSLHFGPSTVGRTVKVVGKLTKDENGDTWISDGSVAIEYDQTGKRIGRKLYCKVASVFLSPSTITPAPSGSTIVTGISQVDSDGTPVIIPSSDNEIESLMK